MSISVKKWNLKPFEEETIRRLAAKPIQTIKCSLCGEKFQITIQFRDGEETCQKLDTHFRLFLISMDGVECQPIPSSSSASSSSIKYPLNYWKFLGWSAGASVMFRLSYFRPIVIQFS